MAAWIFQTNPTRYDLIERATSSTSEETWAMNQHRDVVAVGDLVYFYVSGSNAGIYVKGHVSRPVFDIQNDDSFGRWKVGITFDALVEPPLARGELLADPVLSDVQVFTRSQGTNFAISEDVELKIESLISDRLRHLEVSSSFVESTDDSEANLPKLELHNEYTRELVQQIFDPDGTFTPQTGSWGLQGIVRVPDTQSDYVFFMTYGQSQSGHDFDESISTAGVVTWQSQPGQTLENRRIRQFIQHDENVNSIHLFLRTARDRPYTYLGRLSYLDHDSERSKPVWFHWELMDGLPQKPTLEKMDLKLADPDEEKSNQSVDQISRKTEEPRGIEETAPPEGRPRTQTTRDFRAIAGRDYSAIDLKNRAIGEAGELAVLAHEKMRLIEVGRPDLAERVRHTSVERGDGAGYDVRSFDVSGAPLFIEVKTTRLGRLADFPISPNEVEYSARNPERYALYRVYDFNPKTYSGRYYVIRGDLYSQLDLKPTNYSARLRVCSKPLSSEPRPNGLPILD